MKKIKIDDWKPFEIEKLFTVKRPKSRSVKKYNEGEIPFVSSGNYNNGVDSYREPIDDEDLDKGNCITVSPVDGSTFYQPKDLLEMYCGYGNFTIPLSSKFRAVLANEISKNAIKNALKNCELNDVSNIEFLRMDSNDLMSAFNGASFNRLKDINLSDFDISHILVDPPRAGLSKEVVKFIKNYENIIYVSCNPLTLKENLDEICKTHKVVKFALFDQFPHTKHVDCLRIYFII